MKYATILCLTCILVIGCTASVPSARPEIETKSRSINPPAGKSLLYVVRKKGFDGSGRWCHISINGKLWGNVAVGTYLAGIFDSGKIPLILEDGALGISYARYEITIDLKPGEKHYLLLGSGGTPYKITHDNTLYAKERVMSEEYRLSGENRFADTLSNTYQGSLNDEQSSLAHTTIALPPSNLSSPNASASSDTNLQQSMLNQKVDDTIPALCATKYQYRTALVIGNANYKDAPLRNPTNDARDIANVLRKQGFSVIYKTDVSQREFDLAIREFQRMLARGGAGLFYFSGHGLQVNGENYLVPIDASIVQETDVKYEAVNAAKVLDAMYNAGNPLNLVILDACRNNPFARSFRSYKKGLAQMDAPTGTLIAYATAPGKVASDGPGRNGVYTKHLLKNMVIPELPIERMFKKIRLGVMEETGKKQVPWEHSSIVREFCMVRQTTQR
jgi:hypothetical protein